MIGGKDRGKRGKVLRVEPKKNRVYVEGLNMIKRHQRPQQVAGAQRAEQVGGVIEREGPIHVSNVMLARSRRTASRRASASRFEDGKRLRDRATQRTTTGLDD